MDWDKAYKVFQNVMIYCGLITSRSTDLSTSEKEQFLKEFAKTFANYNITKNFNTLIDMGLYDEQLSVNENTSNLIDWFIEQLTTKKAIKYDNIAGAIIGNIFEQIFISEDFWNLLVPVVAAWVRGDFTISIKPVTSIYAKNLRDVITVDVSTYEAVSSLFRMTALTGNSSEHTKVDNACKAFVDGFWPNQKIYAFLRYGDAGGDHPRPKFSGNTYYIATPVGEDGTPVTTDVTYTMDSNGHVTCNHRVRRLWIDAKPGFTDSLQSYNFFTDAGTSIIEAGSNIDIDRLWNSTEILNNVEVGSQIEIQGNYAFNFLKEYGIFGDNDNYPQEPVGNYQKSLNGFMSPASDWQNFGLFIAFGSDDPLKCDKAYFVFPNGTSFGNPYNSTVKYEIIDNKLHLSVRDGLVVAGYIFNKFSLSTKEVSTYLGWNIGEAQFQDWDVSNGYHIFMDNGLIYGEGDAKTLENYVPDEKVKEAIENGTYDVVTDGKTGGVGSIIKNLIDDPDAVTNPGEFLKDEHAWQTDGDEVLNPSEDVTTKEEATTDANYSPKDDNAGLPISNNISVDTGFYTAYLMRKSELDALANVLWSDASDILVNLKKMFSDPMEACISLSMVPCIPATGARESIKMGFFDTGVSARRITKQFCQIDCGVVDYRTMVKGYETYDNAHLMIYLPFIGVRELSPISIYMINTIKLVYNIDIVSGGCVAYIYTFTQEGEWQITQTFAGNAAQQIPLSSNAWGDIYRGIATIAASVGIAGATGGMGAGALGAEGGSLISPEAASGVSNSLLNFSLPGPSQSGSISGNLGFSGPMVASCWYYYPQTIDISEEASNVNGYPVMRTGALSTCSGFTQVSQVRWGDIGDMTYDEQMEIEELLKKGVYF